MAWPATAAPVSGVPLHRLHQDSRRRPKALYAYLMSQPAVHSETPANQLPFPFDQRQLMAGWNLLFLEPGAYRDEPTRNQQWNRGAYLAEGRPLQRLPLAAQRARRGKVRQRALRPAAEELDRASLERQFAGAHRLERGGPRLPPPRLFGLPRGRQRADGASGRRSLASSRTRTCGPGPLPCASAPLAETDQQQAQRLDRQGYGRATSGGARLFAGACLACHHDGDGPRFFGVRPSLALNSNVHADSPDNLLRIILGASTARPPATSAICPASAIASTTDKSPPWPTTCASVSPASPPGRTSRPRRQACANRRRPEACGSVGQAQGRAKQPGSGRNDAGTG